VGYGKGVNRQLPHLGNPGTGVNRPGDDLAAYMQALADRLRRVRVCCGDWSRVVTDGAMAHGNRVGVFLDPPYLGDVRDKDLYRVEDHSISHAVRDWALAHGDDPRLRIVLAGYEAEHIGHMPASWRVVKWSAKGGYSNNATAGNENRHNERLWFSPHCQRVEDRQLELFGGDR
jgi:hypothetical protein